VRALLERGVGHAQVRRAIERLRAYGDWPLSDAPLATTTGRGRPRVVLREHDAAYVLSPRGWQLMVAAPSSTTCGCGCGARQPPPTAAACLGRMDRRRALLLTAAACVPLAALVYVAAVDVLAFRQLDIRVSAGFIVLSGPHTRALAGDLAGLIDPRQVSPKA
jgi:hypothetical protein